MKKIVKYISTALAVILVFCFFGACMENNLIKSYEQDDDGILIMLKDDIVLPQYYYILFIWDYEFEGFKCTNYKNLIKNEKYTEYACRDSEWKMSRYEVDNRQIYIVGRRADSAGLRVILVYKSNEIVDKSTDLQNYLAVIELVD